MRRQQEIITALEVQPVIDPHVEIERRSQFLADYLGHTGLHGYVIGISGGQDSLLAGMLAKRAVEIRKEAGHEAAFHAVLLPYGEQVDRADAELAIQTINPDCVHDIDIKPAVDAMSNTFLNAEGAPLQDLDKGNVKARMRMIAQYALASQHHLLVIGTDHAAEAVTGFFTKFGDGGADILPLAGLTKRQGRTMLETLGTPNIFTTKPPTADLLDTRPAQTDEHELGVRYDDIDDYLEGKTIDPAVIETIETRYTATTHKRALPYGYPGAAGRE